MMVCMRIMLGVLCLVMLLTPQSFAAGTPSLLTGQATSPLGEKLPFSLTISGGISLGSYEAGVNWALIEYLKARQKDGIAGKIPELKVVTGASAGAINSVISAMLWCVNEGKVAELKDRLAAENLLSKEKINVDNNILREAWVSVGIDDLMPKEEERYCNPGTELPPSCERLVDEMFARSAFERAVAMIRSLMDSKVFKPGQDVRIALLATREIPIEVAVGDIKVKSQRHVFVLRFRTRDDGSGYFATEVERKDLSPLGTVVYLPGIPVDTKQYEISPNDVIRLMYASSAFPVAFGKVDLTYCTLEREKSTTSQECPKGYYKVTADFVDGGTFDNIPLGAAEALVDNPGDNYFFFISPSTRRNVPEPFKDPLWRKKRTYGIDGMIGFIPGFLDSASDHELYMVLRGGGWKSYEDATKPDTYKKLVVTDRYFPITGAYLGHFGAFLDRPFREFDYNAGVYDTVHDLAKFVGYREKMQKEISGEDVQKVYEKLGLTKQGPASEVFALIATQEHGKEYLDTTKGWHWITDPLADLQGKKDPMQIIFKSIIETSKAPVTDDDDIATFNRFVERLHANKYITAGEHSDQMRWIDRKSDDNFTVWYAPLVGRASKRLQMLQDKESDETGKGGLRYLAGGVSLGLGRFSDYDDTFRFQPTSVPKGESWAYNLWPYEIGIDTANGGLFMSYLMRLKLGTTPAFDLKLTPAGYNKFGDDRVGYSQADLYLVANRIGSVWSLGVGPTASYLWKQAEGYHDVNYGAALYAEWFQTIRLTAGLRDVTADRLFGHNWYVNLGFVDIPGFVNRFVNNW